jgi:hypothetical protein
VLLTSWGRARRVLLQSRRRALPPKRRSVVLFTTMLWLSTNPQRLTRRLDELRQGPPFRPMAGHICYTLYGYKKIPRRPDERNDHL